MIELPRWLRHVGFLNRIAELDRKFLADKRTGPLWIEVHYRDGVPKIGKIREAPLILEMGLYVVTT